MIVTLLDSSFDLAPSSVLALKPEVAHALVAIEDSVSFDPADFRIRWFADGVLNVSANCIDRHLETRGDQVAIIWEGDEPGTQELITYRKLHERVCRCANVLKSASMKVRVLTRADATGFFAFVHDHPLTVEVTPYPLAQANEALDALRGGRLQGAAVLVP